MRSTLSLCHFSLPEDFCFLDGKLDTSKHLGHIGRSGPQNFYIGSNAHRPNKFQSGPHKKLAWSPGLTTTKPPYCKAIFVARRDTFHHFLVRDHLAAIASFNSYSHVLL